MTLKKALLAATILALPVAAQAQPVSGLYVGAGVGGNYRTDPTDGGIKAKTKIGWATVGSIGYGFGNGLRAELEGNYRTNQVDSATVPGRPASSSSPWLNTYGAMVNVLYDFRLGWPVVPYIGAGVGYGWNEIEKGTSFGFPSTQTKGEFAYQGILGLAYELGATVPGLALTLEGRYYATLDPSFKDASRVSPTVSQQVNWKPKNENASVLLGFRYALYTPPPPPAPVVAPVAAPALARTYLVFFDWDRADLTARAREIIAEAASNAGRVQATRIEVAGHADRSGSPAYNQRLSQRRADAVAAELVAKGISRSEISVSAYGESRPLVPTADGVREPQNRRVEIVLR
jgi:OmpA-OmpF porin, OOP family